MQRKNCLFALVAMLLLAGSSFAQNFNFVSFDVPCSAFPSGAICPSTGHAEATSALGIGPGGQIVGAYLDGSGKEHGYLYAKGTFTTIDVPGSLVGLSANVSLETAVHGINPAGDMVGDYFAPPGSPDAPACVIAFSPPCDRGFLYSHGKFSSVLVPDHVGSVPNSITPDGTIYGCLHDQTFGKEMFGFARAQFGDFETFTYETLQAGGGELTDNSQSVPNSMNNGATPDGSMIVGQYAPPGSLPHGYIVQSGVFHDYLIPGTMATQIWGVDPAGDFVGFYRTAPGNAGVHGFVHYADAPTLFTVVTIDFPNGHRTLAQAINPAGAIVGSYLDQAGVQHGFLAVPVTSDSE